MYARLVQVHGSTIIDLEKDLVLIGRSNGCDVVPNDTPHPSFPTLPVELAAPKKSSCSLIEVR